MPPRPDPRPAWWFDRDFCTVLALDNLPRVLAEIGAAPPFCWVPQPRWWHEPMMLGVEQRRRHGLPEEPPPVLVCRTAPGVDRLLWIAAASGAWRDDPAGRVGLDPVELVAWRLQIGPAKAAWRIARWAGRREPRP